MPDAPPDDTRSPPRDRVLVRPPPGGARQWRISMNATPTLTPTDPPTGTLTHLAQIRAHYLEMPGLNLTVAQAARLFGVDCHAGAALLAALVDVHFLRRTLNGGYVRADVN